MIFGQCRATLDNVHNKTDSESEGKLELETSMDNPCAINSFDFIKGANIWLKHVKSDDPKMRKIARERCYEWLIRAGYSKQWAYSLCYE